MLRQLRFGLVATVVGTHLPSNLLLAAATNAARCTVRPIGPLVCEPAE